MPQSLDARPALSLLHYWWPVAMGGSIALVVHRATARPVDPIGLALLLSGILAAYSLDRIFDVRDDQDLHRDRAVGWNATHTPWLLSVLHIGAVVGIVVSAALLPLMPVRTAMLVPLLGVVVLAYPRLKALPFLKTVLVSAAWTWSLIALPFHDGSWLGWRAWTTPVAIPIALIIAAGCLLCDLKDVDADREASVGSLPVLVSVWGTIAAAALLASVGASVALAEHRIGLTVGGIGLGLAALRPSLLAQNAVGPLVVDMILTVPGLLIALNVV